MRDMEKLHFLSIRHFRKVKFLKKVGSSGLSVELSLRAKRSNLKFTVRLLRHFVPRNDLLCASTLKSEEPKS
jgi:hypothetical protein